VSVFLFLMLLLAQDKAQAHKTISDDDDEMDAG
jgi:hypothetical protein